MENEINYAVAIATARILAGVLFFFQGYDKVFNVGMKELKETMKAGIASKNIPDSFIGFIAVFSSYVELVGGFLLIIGFFVYPSVYLLCLNLLIISIGFSIARPMWDTGHVMIRVALLIIILLTPSEWDIFSFDYLFVLSGLNP